ncbi:MAG TPA: MBL fold metallo-hydrolase, partial [Ramlibacter sp.]|nr:MBL fold metallo-hydrolase [Ramlibacter sp.]
MRWAALAGALALAFAPTAPAQTVTAKQVSPSAWYAQGEAAVGSAGNRNFISNAGIVVTPAGVVVI